METGATPVRTTDVQRRAYPKATWAFWLGVLGWLFLLPGPVALILGQSAEDDIDGDPRWSNCWMATTGYYLGLFSTLVLFIVLIVGVLSLMG